MEVEILPAPESTAVPWSHVESSGSGHIRVLVRALEPELAAISGLFRLPPEEADDALQDTLSSLFEYRWRIRDLSLWTRRVFWNRCLRWARDSERHRTVSIDSIGVSEEIEGLWTNPSDARLILEQALNAVPPRHRQVLWQARVAGLTWSELAVELGCSRAGAKKAVFRAMKEVRQTMADLARRPAASFGPKPSSR